MDSRGKVIAITIIPILLTLAYHSSLNAEEDITFELEEKKDKVYPGDEAYFRYYCKNNDDFYTVELYLEVEKYQDRSTVSPYPLTLKPGEEGHIVHRFDSGGLKAPMNISLVVSLGGRYYGPLGHVGGDIIPVTGNLMIQVIAKNDTNAENITENGKENNIGTWTEHGSALSYLVLTVMLISVFIGVYYVKRVRR